MAESDDETTPATSEEIAELRNELCGMEDRLILAIEQSRNQTYRTERNVMAKIEELRKNTDSAKGE